MGLYARVRKTPFNTPSEIKPLIVFATVFFLMFKKNKIKNGVSFIEFYLSLCFNFGLESTSNYEWQYEDRV